MVSVRVDIVGEMSIVAVMVAVVIRSVISHPGFSFADGRCWVAVLSMAAFVITASYTISDMSRSLSPSQNSATANQGRPIICWSQ